MAQKVNLNINPYYDDFDSQKNFYKVLFKPGSPVQARELTTLQSILQNQIESFGSHIFKEGSVVIPGNISYDNQFYAIKLNTTNFGVDISVYINNFLGKKIIGQTSGTTATVQYISFPDGNNVEYITLYVKYLDSNNDFAFEQFEDGENLISEENITYGNTTINAGTPFASLIDLNASSIGSSASIGDGIYFIRGYFVNVSKQTIILDDYTNTPSYRVGLNIQESLISAKDDDSLYDNAKGFSNYAAPGADRLQINLTLTKKLLTDVDDTNFVELLRLRDGRKKFIESKTQYNIIKDYLAERTNDESGSYSVNPFQISVHNSLNDKLGGNGLFFEDQKTDELNTPSDDLMCVKVSPGKAYVEGYDVETTGTSILDVEKPRDTKNIDLTNFPFRMGNLLKVNNVAGTPTNNELLTLKNKHKSESTGVEIGKARVYTFGLTDAAYSGSSTKWNLYLYDIQTYTKFILNANISLPIHSHVKGVVSGATGFTVAAYSDKNLIYVTNTTGSFIKGEGLVINGNNDVKRSIKELDIYGISDIKSVENSGSGANDFSADTLLQKFNLPNGVANASFVNSNDTIVSPGNVFTGIKTDTIIRFQSGSGEEHFNRVTNISADSLSLTLEAVTGPVDGVYTGALLTADTELSDIKIGAPILENSESSGLYEKLPNTNISSVDLSNSSLTIREQLGSREISGAAMTATISEFTGISSAFFTSFDADRYSIHYNGGGIGTVTSDSFIFDANQVSFRRLTDQASSNAVVNATLTKNGIVSKVKNYTRSVQVEVNKTSSGVTTTSTGLTTSIYYGLRVEDEEISLNYPDVAKVICVYESKNNSKATFDKIVLSSSASDSIVGEEIVSSNSNAIARVVENSVSNNALSSNTVAVVYLNSDRFVIGEKVNFKESGIEDNITTITDGNYFDVTQDFILDKGQKDQYYDYSKLVRTQNSQVPSKKLLIVLDHYTIPTSDNGDLFTVLSYPESNFAEDIPNIGNDYVRASDTLDFRPRVVNFDASTATKSPFTDRSFTFMKTLSPNEDSLLGYSYYLPRIDKVYIDKSGKLFVGKGVSQDPAREPVNNNGQVMELATISLPPYLYNSDRPEISLIDNRRYTMKDIGRIDDRLENLEEVTSLSLLELNTQTLQIKDSDGRDRFKSGFFVDDFKNNSLIDFEISSIEVNSDSNELTPIISKNTISSQLTPLTEQPETTLDLSGNYDLLDPNTQKTGNIVTLKYNSIDWIEQPLATRVENANPFHVVSYNGVVTLTPSSDTWVRTIRLAARNINAGTVVQRFGGGLVSRVFTNSWSRDVIVSSGEEEFMRSRNTQFSATNLKPLTKFYQFLDGNGRVDFIPKLIEIANDDTLENSGSSVSTFQAGETVVGSVGDDNLITFRLANSNHKYGPHRSPTTVFNINPYLKSENIPTEYSSSSKTLNVDTFALSSEAQGEFSGYLVNGMKLVGQTSGAVSYVKNIRLISDNYGDLIGSFFLRDPFSDPAPSVRISTGNKTYKLTNSSTNQKPLPGSKLISSAEVSYDSQGTWERRQFVSFRQTFVQFFDPLAQTFTVGGNIDAPDFTGQNDDSNGAILTEVDLYFANIPSGNDPVRVEIRTVELGTPTRVVLEEPAVLRPRTTDENGNEIIQIQTSTTGEIATKVVFPTPIYLAPGREYALVIVSETSDEYELWTAQMGEKTVNTQSLPDAESVRYTKQFAMGSLFKSQNGSIWTPNQYQDLKFKLRKAQFVPTSGTAFFHNPSLDINNDYVQTLGNNPIRTLPKTGNIGITTIIESGNSVWGDLSNILKPGRKLSGNTPGSVAFIVGTGSSVNSVAIQTGGLNYETDAEVETYSVTGQGFGLKLNVGTVNIDNGQITVNPTIVDRGHGYQVGDVVGIVTSSTTSRSGRDAFISISEISGIDTLFLSGIQGEFGSDANHAFKTGIGVSYYPDPTANTIVSMGSTTILRSEVSSSEIPNRGTYFRVNHFNHGMYSGINSVRLSNVQSSYIPTTLTSAISADSTTGDVITVSSSTELETFEGFAINSSNGNYGYMKIGNEIISYSAASSGNITIHGRGIDGTKITTHSINSNVYKYELNGVSLRRINQDHQLNSFDIDSDGYYIEIDRSETYGLNREEDSTTKYPQLSFIDDSFVGGNSIKPSENIEFSEVIPSYDVITPGTTTSINTKIRTVSGTSVSGNEASFLDQGFEIVELNTLNKLSTTRLVCSKINEGQHLTNLPRNKSLTTGITLNRSDDDDNLSPIIYLDTARTELRSARLNNPVTKYENNDTVRSSQFDPHSAVYVSNTVNLKNPATSLKVILSAYRDQTADFRVLYKLNRVESSEIDQTFDLFPGYDNLKYNNEEGYLVLDPSKNTGRSDAYVNASSEDEYLEYQFTADNLELFTGYTIKIVMSGTNQAKYPRIKDLRSIAIR